MIDETVDNSKQQKRIDDAILMVHGAIIILDDVRNKAKVGDTGWWEQGMMELEKARILAKVLCRLSEKKDD
jgi:hypothetical protein